MSNNKVVPFIPLPQFFDNIKYDHFDNLWGDCKTCKAPAVKIFEHECWRALRAESKKLYAQQEGQANEKV